MGTTLVRGRPGRGFTECRASSTTAHRLGFERPELSQRGVTLRPGEERGIERRRGSRADTRSVDDEGLLGDRPLRSACSVACWLGGGSG